MADNYYITINGEKICVSEEVYNAYRQMRRHERTLAEKDSRNYVLKYEDFADGEITGEEQIYDFLQPSVEELALTNLIYRKLHRAIEKAYYVTGSTDDKSKATRFTPRSDGRMLIYGIEDDAYTITELKTDGAYTLLKNGIGLVISVGESSTVCDVYSSDVLGLIQNDPRYADIEEGLFHNMPQKHLEHKLLTASAKVDNKQVTLGSDNGSANAFVPLTVVNTKGFDLPKTGGYGNWMFPAVGLSLVAVAVVVIYFAFRDKKKETNK